MEETTKKTRDKQFEKQLVAIQTRVDSLEDILFQGKEVLSLEEAAKFMGIARSSLYKMTHQQAIPFYKPNGKLVFFEKSDWRTRQTLWGGRTDANPKLSLNDT